MNKVLLNDLIPKIGKVLRVYREKSGRGQADIAVAAGISVSMLSQIERGLVSPSIDTLVMVCAALGLEAADLFRQVSLESPVRIHHPQQRLRSEAKSGVRYEQLMTDFTGGHPSEMFLLEVDPGSVTALSHTGHEGVEMGYILSGAAILTVQDTDYPVQEGDSVFFSAALPHRLSNSGRKLFRAVWSISPPHVDYLETDEVGRGAPVRTTAGTAGGAGN